MHRRDVLKTIPLMTLVSPADPSGALTIEPTSEAPTSGADSESMGQGPRVLQARTQVNVLIVGLWLLDFHVARNVHVLGAVNSAGTEIPGSGGMKIHDHKPYIILPADMVENAAPGAMDVDEVDRDRWRFLPQTPSKKFLLSKQFWIRGMREDADDHVFGAFPIGRVHSKPRKLDWYTDANMATAWLEMDQGLIRDAPPRKPDNKVTWTFKNEAGEPKTDIPVRLTDTLEIVGSGPFIKIDLGSGAINKPSLPKITAFLINLPDEVTEHEATHKRVLYHTAAMYKVFETNVLEKDRRIPRTDAATYPSGDPVFCPPGVFP